MKRIVLIEDEDGPAIIMRRNFAQFMPDWRVEVATNMRDGLKACDTHVDLILLDLMLPDCTLENSIQSIAALSQAAPVLVLTGRTIRETDTFSECFRMGADDVWEKTALHGGGITFFIYACVAAIARNEARKSHV